MLDESYYLTQAELIKRLAEHKSISLEEAAQSFVLLHAEHFSLVWEQEKRQRYRMADHYESTYMEKP